MDKKFITIGVFVVLALIAGGVLLYEKDVQKKESSNKNPVENTLIDTNEDKGTERDTLDENLVWYEVPELGIKFQVEEWAKDDLGYVVGTASMDLGNNNDSIYAYFYPKSMLNEYPDECYVNSQEEITCSVFSMSRFGSEEELRLKGEGMWQVQCPVKAKEFSGYSICYQRHNQVPYYGMDEESYLQYKETHPKDIYFAVKFDTVTPL